MLLSWYDRDVAAALFEPVRAEMEQSDDLTQVNSEIALQAWSIFDPRAAVARLEQVPVNPNLDLREDAFRERVLETLGLPHEARWRFIWLNFTEMADFFIPDEVN